MTRFPRSWIINFFNHSCPSFSRNFEFTLDFPVLSTRQTWARIFSPLRYLPSPSNAQPTSSGGFFHVRKSFAMKKSPKKIDPKNSARCFSRMNPYSPAENKDDHEAPEVYYMLSCKFGRFFRLFVIFGDTVERNPAHQLIW